MFANIIKCLLLPMKKNVRNINKLLRCKFELLTVKKNLTENYRIWSIPFYFLITTQIIFCFHFLSTPIIFLI